MHKQRIWVASFAGVGLLTAFLPWVTVLGLVGVTAMDFNMGWVVLVLFGAALVVSLTGARAYALDGARQGIISVCGLAATGFGIWKYIEIKRGTLDIGGELGQQMQHATGGGSAGRELGHAMGKGMMKMFGADELVEMSFGIYALIGAGILLVIAALWKKRAA